MVAAFDYCLHGKGGAAPSIDTAMHGLVDAAHVDHLHPDSGIAIATAADGEELTVKIFGDKVAWVPWRRPGFQLGLDIAKIKADAPQAIGCILGGHGITAWGDTSAECEQNSLWIIKTAADYIATNAKAEPFGAPLEGYEPLPEAERRARAAALAPTIRSIASQDRLMVGHFTDSEVVLDFLSHAEHPRLSALGTSCPDHFLRTKVKPLLLDLPPTASVPESIARLRELHEAYRDDYRAYYDRNATPDSPAIRGADPLVVLVPGVGMFSFGKDKQTARVAGEFYVNAINVMRGAEGLSTYAPIDEAEKFRIEYWALEEAKLARMPKPKPLSSRIAFVTGAASGIGKAIANRLAAEGAVVVIADLSLEKAEAAAAEIGGSDVAVGVQADVSDESRRRCGAERDAARVRRGRHRGEQRRAVAVQGAARDDRGRLGPAARRDGQGLVPGLARRGEDPHRARVWAARSSTSRARTRSSPGPNNIAYSATKADQAHQVRLLAAELGGHGIRVNGINPDGVVQGSGIFSSGWGANRAAVYGVEEKDLGAFYAQRTLLKREVLPDHVASAVFALVGPDLVQTTGLHIPVDAGVAAAFLR